MISRVAESCFWLNRYIERVESLARMLDVNLAFQLDVELADAERWRPLVIVTGQEEDFDARGHGDPDDAEVVQSYLVWEADNPSSLLSSLGSARENARTIRETISLEMWETLNDLWVWMNERVARRLYENDRHAFYIRLRDQSMLFHGIAHTTMLHEDAFEFMRLGTALERVSQTARVLDVKHHSIGPSEGDSEVPGEAAQWQATLRFCSGVEPFYKRGENEPSGRLVARFLIFDRSFPRSVIHNLYRAHNFLTLLRPDRDSEVGADSDRLLAETIDHLERLGIGGVLAEGLHEVLTWIVDTTSDVCEQVRRDFFETPQRTAVAGEAARA